jgi:hypothetical protein
MTFYFIGRACPALPLAASLDLTYFTLAFAGAHAATLYILQGLARLVGREYGLGERNAMGLVSHPVLRCVRTCTPGATTNQQQTRASKMVGEGGRRPWGLVGWTLGLRTGDRVSGCELS